MSAKDDLKIYMNILAQSPDGLSDPNLIGKFSKAKAQLNQFDSMAAMQSQPVAPPVPTQPPIGAQTPLGGESIPQMQNEGQGALNLP
jgi:hypothetical protein